MSLRERFTTELKSAMIAKDAPRTSTVRMILAKLKDADIAARPKDPDAPQKVTDIGEDAIVSMLRGMVKTRRESVELYRKGGREELAAKEEAEIAVIEGFLPKGLDADALKAAVDEAVASTGATSVKEMGKVVGALKAKFGAALDMAVAGPLVKARLGA